MIYNHQKSVKQLIKLELRAFAGDTENSTLQQSTRNHEPEHGFVMAMHYNDQLTGSTGNLLNLQCFVGHHMKEVKVVEPFLNPFGSILGVGLSPSFEKLDRQDMNTVKLSDMFDINEWTKYSRSRNYASLISWNDFLKSCPNRLILVYHTWRTNDCSDVMTQATKEFVTENNFDVVKQVCIELSKVGTLSPQKYVDIVYGEFKPNEVVVIINRWDGISAGHAKFRLSISGTSCHRGNDIRLFHHSKLISSDCKNYFMTYLNKTDNYMAVMVRVEYFAINHNLNKLPAEAQRNKLMECFKSISTKVESVKRERNINTTLLTMDIGKYGSFDFRRGGTSRLDINILYPAVHDFIEMLFGKSLTQDEWEQSFENVAQLKAPGYIAVMQKALAANSVCLLLVGGGSFQNSAVALYDELHPGSKCVLHAC